MNLQDMQQENIFPFFCFLYVFLMEEKKMKFEAFRTW